MATEPKTRPTKESVAAFLAAIPDERRRRDCKVVAKMMEKATGARGVMWGASIVGYGAYQVAGSGGRVTEWPVVAFSPRKTDLTLYIMPGFERFADLLARLGNPKTGRSCLYLRRLEGLDLAALEEIVARSVHAMAGRRVR